MWADPRSLLLLINRGVFIHRRLNILLVRGCTLGLFKVRVGLEHGGSRTDSSWFGGFWAGDGSGGATSEVELTVFLLDHGNVPDVCSVTTVFFIMNSIVIQGVLSA